MRRAFVDIDEGQVHYRTEGNGDILLLLHQTPMSSSEYSQVIPILSKEYCVVAMDTLGYGDSDSPPRHYTIGDYAASVVRFLDALNIKRVNVAGHHTGALIAAEFAAMYPERIIKLVLSGCPCFKQPEEGQSWMKKYPPLEVEANGSHLIKIWGIAMELTLRHSIDLAQSYTVDFLKTGLGEKAEEGHVAAFIYDAYPQLPLIKTRTLLLWGDQDMLYPYAEVANRLVPNKKVEVIKGGNALYHRLMPREWAQAIIEFLRIHPS